MRKIGSLVLLAATGATLAGAALAQSREEDEPEILSSEPGALLPPENWDCSLYVQEYEQFLYAGNPPESWRFVGKTYKSVGEDLVYDWETWLEWYEQAGCDIAEAPVAPETPGGANSGGGSGGLFGGDMKAVGIVGGLLLAGAAAAAAGGGGGDSGANNKSPG